MAKSSQQSEAQPLLSGQRPEAYTDPASEPNVKKKHFNIVGLSPAAFWALVRPKASDDAIELTPCRISPTILLYSS